MFGLINGAMSVLLGSVFSENPSPSAIIKFWSQFVTTPLRYVKQIIGTALWIYIEVVISLFAWMFPQAEINIGEKRESRRESRYKFSFFSWQPATKVEDQYKEEIRKRDNRIADLQSEIDRLNTPGNSRRSSVAYSKSSSLGGKLVPRRRKDSPSISCSPLKIISPSAIRDYFDLGASGSEDSESSIPDNMEDMHGWAELTLAWELYKEAKRDSPDGDLSSLMSGEHSRASTVNSMKITPEDLKMLGEDDSDTWAGSIDTDALTSCDTHSGLTCAGMPAPQVMNGKSIDIPPEAMTLVEEGIDDDCFGDVLKGGFSDVLNGGFSAVLEDKNAFAGEKMNYINSISQTEKMYEDSDNTLESIDPAKRSEK